MELPGTYTLNPSGYGEYLPSRYEADFLVYSGTVSFVAWISESSVEIALVNGGSHSPKEIGIYSVSFLKEAGNFFRK
jgi:hypothetical protein